MLEPISRVKDSHPNWWLERPLGSFKELQWIYNIQVQLYHLVDTLGFISFPLPSHILSPYFIPVEWGALGETFIFLRELLLLHIFYFDLNNIISMFIKLSGWKSKIFYALLISNKETVPFPTSLLQTLIILVDLNGCVKYWLFMHEWNITEEYFRFHIH